MENVVITIARHFGSGGKTIGEMLAKDLGIHCYNREIIRMASEDSGISEILFNRADERVKRSFLFGKAHPEYKGKVIPPESDGFVSDKNLFNYQAKIIRELAERESCVIIGRAADYVLKDYDNVVRVYVHASKEYCIQQTIERRAYVGKDVERFIAKTDKYRSDYYRYYTGREWTDARNYDLCLNSECLGFDKCVEAVKAYIKVRFGGLPQGEKE
ncbi:MAG TPA: cytidylate kinase-like family protein [Candidatus Choladousia intestinigallinarum]|nr:cytidylate kinase-like family protein [Candidatus Choladousia intestinigallinarum]